VRRISAILLISLILFIQVNFSIKSAQAIVGIDDAVEIGILCSALVESGAVGEVEETASGYAGSLWTSAMNLWYELTPDIQSSFEDSVNLAENGYIALQNISGTNGDTFLGEFNNHIAAQDYNSNGGVLAPVSSVLPSGSQNFTGTTTINYVDAANFTVRNDGSSSDVFYIGIRESNGTINYIPNSMIAAHGSWTLAFTWIPSGSPGTELFSNITANTSQYLGSGWAATKPTQLYLKSNSGFNYDFSMGNTIASPITVPADPLPVSPVLNIPADPTQLSLATSITEYTNTVGVTGTGIATNTSVSDQAAAAGQAAYNAAKALGMTDEQAQAAAAAASAAIAAGMSAAQAAAAGAAAASNAATGSVAATNSLLQSIVDNLDMSKPFVWTPLTVDGTLLTNKFPFSLPWDLQRAITALNTSPSFPPLTLQFINPVHMFFPSFDSNVSYPLTIDVTTFTNVLAPIVRSGFLLLFMIGLIFATRKLLGGAS